MRSIVTVKRRPKDEGSIASIFSSLSGEAAETLPPRFAQLKKELWKESLVQSWRQVVADLREATEEVAAKGSDVGRSVLSMRVVFKRRSWADLPPGVVCGSAAGLI